MYAHCSVASTDSVVMNTLQKLQSLIPRGLGFLGKRIPTFAETVAVIRIVCHIGVSRYYQNIFADCRCFKKRRNCKNK